MNDGKVNAGHYATGQPTRLRWRDGRVLHYEFAPVAPKNLWLAPALFDLQVNGYGGVDFQRDGVTLDDLLSATRQLQTAGCARFLLTITTDPWPAMLARLKRFRELRAQSPELRAAIAGWHIEGPFLSPEPGFCGAHDPSVMCDPTPQHIRELCEATAGDPVLLTVAPERAGVLQAIAQAAAQGIRVSLGHTNASAEAIRAAVAAGAVSFTHLANGCPQQLDRHDNILWRVFETPGLMVGLIPDQIHVSPALFRIIHRQLDAAHIWYTTDAVAPAGAPPGRYKIGWLEVEVGPDQVVRQPGRTNFAGSALRPVTGVLRAAKMLGCSWRDTWGRFAAAPRNLMGLMDVTANLQDMLVRGDSYRE
ncbi:MAG: N-acetylglucosamine-6-phosphate deacetylase, partial [Planctomycetota bacterium]|nr:N-acetylglucosamine-6-phosphate deacetylase [Planctomycetota bacterium]